VSGKWKIALVAAIVGGAALCVGAGLTLSRATTTSSPPERRLQLHVPHATVPIPIDAEIEGKKVWEPEAGRTGNFTDTGGKGMVPYTEVKLRWGDGKLYFLMYAGDLDLEGSVREPDGPVVQDDSFHVEIGDHDTVRVVEVSVLGTVTDAWCYDGRGATKDSATPVDVTARSCDRGWQSHAQVAVDTDGTLNRVGDNDEEWVVEMALPFEALRLSGAGPGTRIPLAIRRCEVGARGRGACGSWGMGPVQGEVILDP
jgi:hypothetical protein